jgi:mlo protein
MNALAFRNVLFGFLVLTVLNASFLYVSAGSGKSIEEEPSWVVVVMLLSFLFISILVEHGMEHIHHKLSERHSEGLLSVHHKIKDELMLMGFISLILVALEDRLLSICIPMNAVIGVPCWHDESHPGLNFTRAHGRRFLLAAEKRDELCDEGYTKLLDLRAIHHIHILIFCIAVMHILYSCVLIVLSQAKMAMWTGWETWGDDPKETLDLLQKPPQHVGWVRSFCEQFYNSLDPIGFLTVKRYFVIRAKKKAGFQFGAYVTEMLEHDFTDFVGISWWMWFILILQVVSEGYDLGRLSVFASMSVVFSVYTSTRCRMLLVHLSDGVYTEYTKGLKDEKVTHEILNSLQHTDLHADRERLDDLEPEDVCPCGCSFLGYDVFKTMIRFVMFQNSSSLSQAAFYWWQIGTDACYFNNRNSAILIFQIVLNLSMLLHNSLVTVPLYCVVTVVADHEKKSKSKGRKISLKHNKSYVGRPSSKVNPSQGDSNNLTAKHVMRISEVFQRFDSDGDQRINAPELKELWGKLAKEYSADKANKTKIGEPTREEANFILKALDDDKTGFIEKGEFVEWISSGMTMTEAERKAYSESGSLQKKLGDLLTLMIYAISKQ